MSVKRKPDLYYSVCVNAGQATRVPQSTKSNYRWYYLYSAIVCDSRAVETKTEILSDAREELPVWPTSVQNTSTHVECKYVRVVIKLGQDKSWETTWLLLPQSQSQLRKHSGRFPVYETWSFISSKVMLNMHCYINYGTNVPLKILMHFNSAQILKCSLSSKFCFDVFFSQTLWSHFVLFFSGSLHHISEND